MNMNPGRFYIPGYIGMRSIPISNSMLGFANSAPKGIGLFSKITNGVRSVNWSGFLNNANKTLNVVNQAIPLIRQAGPMVNNMLRVVKVFGSETTINNKKNIYNNLNNTNNLSINSNNDNISIQKKEVLVNSAPNFFI